MDPADADDAEDAEDAEDEGEGDEVPADGKSGELQMDAEVTCPCCGEIVLIALDPAAGSSQDYDEDCQVCCRPWRVRVDYDAEGAADVRVEPA